MMELRPLSYRTISKHDNTESREAFRYKQEEKAARVRFYEARAKFGLPLFEGLIHVGEFVEASRILGFDSSDLVGEEWDESDSEGNQPEVGFC